MSSKAEYSRVTGTPKGEAVHGPHAGKAGEILFGPARTVRHRRGHRLYAEKELHGARRPEEHIVSHKL